MKGRFLGAKVLVVDDEPLFVEIARNWLEEDGYQTEGAENGVEALELLSTFKADLVLSGIVMPHMDGLTLLRRCQEDYPGLPVILTSGGRSLTEEELKKGGAAGFLSKPFSQGDLRKIIGTVMT
jgi:two-component system response regulator (stage 0 sporulation protein F)